MAHAFLVGVWFGRLDDGLVFSLGGMSFFRACPTSGREGQKRDQMLDRLLNEKMPGHERC